MKKSITPDKVALIVPTMNAGLRWSEWLDALRGQTFRPDFLLDIDSESDDGTIEMARKAGFEVFTIPRDEFNHGGTRQLAVDMIPLVEIIVFLTQDAMLSQPDSLERLIAVFDDKSVGGVYGRQIPYEDASPIAAHARLFNYPAESQIKTKGDIPKLGIKTAFMSNSFAAYRRSALMEIGGFPQDMDFGEDSFVAAKMIMRGYKIAYRADALVYHSHNYTIREEFKRYIEVGSFHERESWINENFGRAEGEGARFVLSELKYLRISNPLLIPSAIVRTLLKWIAYRYGRMITTWEKEG